MGFIKNALIGIALYEAIKYCLRTQEDSTPKVNFTDIASVGADPETPLTGESLSKDSDDPWKNSLANDELRSPDS